MIDRISQSNIQNMLETLRAYQAQSQGVVGNTATPMPISPTSTSAAPDGARVDKLGQPNFFNAVQNAIDNVNDAQRRSAALQEAYDRGEDVPMTDVVLAMQKSSLAFEATLQVRNKVMKAYEEIMNMPV
jgi:flagellar hook-basal body complex protein FliE